MKKKISQNQQKPAGRTTEKRMKLSRMTRAEQWCASHRLWIITGIIFLSLLFRIIYFVQLNNTDLVNHHRWDESDMNFFDQWAKRIAQGDLLSDTAMHPIHSWTGQIADNYLKEHPEELQRFRAEAGTDTLVNTPAKLLWDRWYGGKQFHQEPLYPYFVALIYKLSGNNVLWVFVVQLLFGILINLLVYLVARRYFSELVAVIAAFITIFFGPLLFNDMVLLRTTMTTLMAILVPYVIGTALLRKRFIWWLVAGFTGGVAVTLNAYFIIYMLGCLIILCFILRKQLRYLFIASVGLIAGLLLAFSPLIIRNAQVGVPVMAFSSNGAIGFITMNNNTFQNFRGWYFDKSVTARIMGESDGNMMKAIVPTLKTHESIGSYLGILWGKFHSVFSWYENPSNTNFFFYRECTGILYITFITFLLLSPFAIPGIILAIYKKINAWPLYMMILVLMVPLLAFMVLARYRIGLMPLLAPFAALTIVEIFSGTWRGWKKPLIIAGVILLFFWTDSPRTEYTVKVF
ncbi:MAG: glycosyltransferase family 39 protein, partial [Bacteroidia bacterium]|nr:glycosyltransferase family 39 protein [Bacteroidia bacterium]